ncbi:diaminobutyrate--2-oxoglutarate transaminase [Pseudomonas sp. BCA14]|uniref:diaminobutyrate--2-oxoglutarate transaminase n=1 Tax=unclassified Pseudomonas TaxID=196821 RepID=UPI00106E0029|nr:diaminobutyrate--2-oxoglutarate transaminase [Pseudomonas sp. JMN1]TFF06224.1 diaminobutyrate--2-oxoglutarate transaminase [Pseudomonas sp. BCA17]TFF22213.1 diaminobutyrate--2-oxoglutarate transaminase [Pseudomonas sp. BCA14]TFF26610.1 diaminobutyrate--2-oxoglutarate transaminase [Pseudomonas sp. BCA13]
MTATLNYPLANTVVPEIQQPLDIFERKESNVRSYCRDFTDTFHTAEGSTLTSEQGQVFIDFFSGAGALNYGHNNPVLKAALLEYIAENGITHGLDFKTTAKKAFLTAFEEHILAPRNLRYKVQFPGPTGTNSVEAAIKLARKYTGRQNVVAFTNAFHGMSLGSLALTSNPRKRAGAGVTLSNVTFMPYDQYFGDSVDTSQYLANMLRSGSGIDKPAAIVLETVQGEGGVNSASAAWVQAVQHIARAHDILLIIDDIQAGCGRTGDFFSFETLGVTPDIVTLSKSISGYGLPMSLVLLAPHLDVWEPGEHNGTFRGNNLAFVTGKAVIEHYWRDTGFTQALKAKADFLQASLTALSQDFAAKAPNRLKGRGFFRGIEFEDKTLAQRIAAQAYLRGLIIETSGIDDQVLKFLPALTITPAQITQGLQILEQAFAEVTA